MDRPRLDDPILRFRRQFLADLDRYCDSAEERFADVLNGAAVNRQAGEFREEFSRLIAQLDRRSVYNSTILTEWIAALEKGLNLVRAGANPELLNYYTDAKAFRHDAALEFPGLYEDADVRRVTIHGRINVIALDHLVGSHRMGTRVEQSMPGYPDGGDYLRLDAAQLERVAHHLSASLDLLREFDQVGYDCLLASVHSIYACVLKIEKNTMGGRDNSRGSIIAGISENRIERQDIISTAAELYHEHCHLKLSIFCHVRGVKWPPGDNVISPFKNENRSFKWVLHTIYTIGIECGIRLDMLDRRCLSARRAELGFLASVGYRLELLRRSYAASGGIKICPEFGRINELGAVVATRIFEQVDRSSPEERAAYLEELNRVVARHVWDIGQLLLRDVEVADPGLGVVKRTGDCVDFEYEGEMHRATIEPGRFSIAVYGKYVNASV